MCVGATLVSLIIVGLVSMHELVPFASAQLSGLLSQGLTMTETRTANGRTTTTTSYFSGNATKTVSPDGIDSIVRFDQQKLITIDNKKKTYSELTFQQMQEMSDKLATAVPSNPEAIAAMKKLGLGGSTAPVSVTKQGPGETIAGYATNKYLVSGPFDMEIWAAPDLRVPVAYYDGMKALIPANPMFDMRQMYEAFKQIDGWPVKYVMTMKMMMGRSMTTTTEVTSVQKGAIPPSTFEVPAGYKLVQEKF
jgi:hypothetical protein